ncbi:MAG: phosphatase PAP2 family protein [Treponema sp.]|nr:phosphatase PAP2 family protein [Treponema sp.]
MNGILAWGLDVIRAVQGIENPWLTAIMKGITFFGSGGFFLVALPFVYWVVDRKRGERLALVFLFSIFVNLWLKNLWGQPRPFEFLPALALVKEAGYGLPSGHSQASVVFWGMLATLIARPWGMALAVALPLIVGFSRIYLGVHFPTDVFAGWAIGLVFVVADRLVADRFDRLLAVLGGRWRLISLAFVALIMNAFYRSDVAMSGAFLGAGLGFAWADDKASFSVVGGFFAKAGRVLLGLALAVIVYFAFKAISPQPGAELYSLARFIRFAMVGFTVAFVAPWIFLKLKLAPSA